MYYEMLGIIFPSKTIGANFKKFQNSLKTQDLKQIENQINNSQQVCLQPMIVAKSITKKYKEPKESI